MNRIHSRFLSSSRRCFETSSKEFRVAIVGSGPAGFYSAHHLLHKASPTNNFRLKIDIFERLPAPYGLSRYGVAPDHPEVKNCEEYLDNLMERFSSSKITTTTTTSGGGDGGSGEDEGRVDDSNHNIRFLGNVEIGKDISLKNLESKYHSVILSYGCTAADNKLTIPGADSKGVISAREFVNWYNGHPNYYSDNCNIEFTPPSLDQVEDVTIIGNGNVALDVARILLADPKIHWKKTDITEEALSALRQSKVKNVNIVARRGLLESAFSNKEIRELLELSKNQPIKFIPIDPKILQDLEPMVASLGRVDKRRLALLKKYSETTKEEDYQRTWSLQYLQAPAEIVADNPSTNFVSKTIFNLNDLKYDPLTGQTQIVPNGKTKELKSDLVITSIGYKGTSLDNMIETGILFDEKTNRIMNKQGRVLSTSSTGTESNDAIYKPGWYTSGWIKTGPKGVIATTMMESFETADHCLSDLANGIHTDPADANTDILGDLLKDKDVVTWQGWQKINDIEMETGKAREKTREKICDKAKMVEIACH